MRKTLAPLDPPVRHALWASVKDGVLWALMFGLSENYLFPVAILFGATALHTSLIQGMGQLGVAAAQLSGAWWLRDHPKRKPLTISGNIVHATSWLVVFWGAFFLKSPWVILAAYSIGLFFTSFAGPGWTSWMNDLVPENIRGRFWGKRNNIIGLVQFVVILGSGILLRFAEPRGQAVWVFAVMFSLAFVFRFASIYYLNAQMEPPMLSEKAGAEPSATGSGTEGAPSPSAKNSFGFLRFIRDLPRNAFGRFVIFSVLTTFAVNIMNPLMPVFLIKELKVDYLWYTLITMASMVMSFVAMSYWGPLSDRFGNYRILKVTAVMLPALAFAWAFVKQPVALVGLQLVSGFVWAGFNLSTTNYIFDSISKASMARYTAFFQSINNLCAFAGSLLGGALSLVAVMMPPISLPWSTVPLFSAPGFEWIFILSGLLRVLTIGFFLASFSEVRKVDPSPPFHYFYVYQPFTIFLNRFQNLAGRLRIKDDEDGDGTEGNP